MSTITLSSQRFSVSPLSSLFSLYQGSALSLTSAQYSLIDIQTARKMKSQPIILAGQLD